MFYLLFLIVLSVLCFLYFKLVNSKKLNSNLQSVIDEKLKEISVLQNNVLTLQNILKETKTNLEELQGITISYRKRLDRLEKYESLHEIEELDNELEKLKQQEKEYRAKINEHITSANIRAKQIIVNANKRAEEIAGDAINVARDFRQYEQAVKAMKNIIKGYGNQYIVPGRSLLDDLADVYGHTEAGRELKRVRDHVRQMVTNGMAAECDYVEPSRRDTAITFVIDAFNGKVDSILSRSKRDNYGILQQEILDAFSIVNLNGSAFRNARITNDFLNARLDELKWACSAHEVRQKHIEEQRNIREQMREEEKARKEYERAIKDAAKEERMLQKALEIARRELTDATEEQKMQYEAKLQELQKKLQETEEKNRRAISMAQQTKSGHVYIISNIGSFGENIYKIGMTRRFEPMDRVKELGDASVPFDFDVHAMIYSEDAPSLENSLHKHFLLNRVNKVNHRREFFRASIEEIRQQVDEIGLQSHWTMAAEARQYYETKTIEDAIANNPEKMEEWVRSQYNLDEEELSLIISGNNLDEDED